MATNKIVSSNYNIIANNGTGNVNLTAASLNVPTTANVGLLVANRVNSVQIGNSYPATKFTGILDANSNAQTNITSVGTLISLAVSGAISANSVHTTGNTVIDGNLYVAGNTTIAGNIQQISGNSGSFFGNVVTGFNALYAGIPVGYATLPNSPVEVATSANSYSQVNIQNINPGPAASGDLVLTADNGNDVVNYIDMGITSSTWDGSQNNSLGNAVVANDAYMYVQGNVGIGNLVIGTTSTSTNVSVIVGGTGSSNLAATFNPVNTVSTSTSTGTFVVRGGVGVAGTLTATSFSGNGAGLTNIPGNAIVGSYGNPDVANFLNGNIATDIIPNTLTQTLGNAARPWQSLYVSNATIYVNSVPLSVNASNVLTVNNDAVAFANGTQNITTTGNITGGNLTVTGNIVTPPGTGLALGNFNISVANNTLMFTYNGSNIASLDEFGNFTTANNVTGFGTV